MEAGRLGNEPYCEDDDQAGNALQEKWDSPGVVAVDVQGTVGDQSSGDTAAEPAVVVETCGECQRLAIQEDGDILPAHRPRQCGGAISMA